MNHDASITDSGKRISSPVFSVSDMDEEHAFIDQLLEDRSYYEGYDTEYYYLSCPAIEGGTPRTKILRVRRDRLSDRVIAAALEKKKAKGFVETIQTPAVEEYELWRKEARLQPGMRR